MEEFHHLAAALLDPSENKARFVDHCHALHSRVLNLPSRSGVNKSHRRVALALCVFSHLCGASIDSAFSVLQTMAPSDPSAEGACSREQLAQVCKTEWLPAVDELALKKVYNDGEGAKMRRLFHDYYIAFVPSILFSHSRAALLLDLVRENGGDGKVFATSEMGFREASTLRGEKTYPFCNVIVCADIHLIYKYSTFYQLDARPPKWLRDSLRDSRIKHPSLYVKKDEGKNCSPAKRKSHEANISCKHLPSPAKRPRSTVAKVLTAETVKPAKDHIPSFRSPREKEGADADEFRGRASSPLSSKRGERDSKLEQPSTKPLSWACEIRTSFSGGDFPMNDKICELLGVVQQSCLMKKDQFRATGYQRAIARIRALRQDITTVDDVAVLTSGKGIGTKLERKIIEIVKTGRLLQAESVLENAESTAVRQLCNVWGIGPVKALHLIAQGIKSVAQLRDAVKHDSQILCRNQKIGLRHYEDLLLRIPRRHVAELEKFVRMVVKSVDQSLDITVAGSYLRGKKDCGDVDILICGSSEQLRFGFVKVVKEMRKKGVLTDDLTIAQGKYFGIFRFPGRPHARVDLFAVPHEEYPFALLTYTGSAIFNRYVTSKVDPYCESVDGNCYRHPIFCRH